MLSWARFRRQSIPALDGVDRTTVMPHVVDALVKDNEPLLKALVERDLVSEDFAVGRAERKLLHLCSSFGAVNCMRYLVKLGYDINCTDVGGVTPVHLAASNGHKACLKALIIEFHADTTIIDRHGYTLVHWLASNGRTELLKYVLDLGLNIDIVDKNGQTLLHVTCHSGHADTATVLVENGIDVDAQDVTFKTALHYVCAYGQSTCCGVLLDHGARQLPDINGKLPLTLALDNGQKECILKLVHHHPSLIRLVIDYALDPTNDVDKAAPVLHHLSHAKFVYCQAIIKAIVEKSLLFGQMLTCHNGEFEGVPLKFRRASLLLASTLTTLAHSDTPLFDLIKEDIKNLEQLWFTLHHWMVYEFKDEQEKIERDAAPTKQINEGGHGESESLSASDQSASEGQEVSQNHHESTVKEPNPSPSIESNSGDNLAASEGFPVEPPTMAHVPEEEEEDEVGEVEIEDDEEEEEEEEEDEEEDEEDEEDEEEEESDYELDVLHRNPLAAQRQLQPAPTSERPSPPPEKTDLVSRIILVVRAMYMIHQGLEVAKSSSTTNTATTQATSSSGVTISGPILASPVSAPSPTHSLGATATQPATTLEKVCGALRTCSPPFRQFFHDHSKQLALLVHKQPESLLSDFDFVLQHDELMKDFQPTVIQQPLSMRCEWFFQKIQALNLNRQDRRFDTVVMVDRDNILQSSCQRLEVLATELTSFGIEFKDEPGRGNGVKREWFSLVCRELFNPDFALFEPAQDGVSFIPNINSSINPDHLSYFALFGRLLAMALVTRQTIPARLGLPLYLHLMNLSPSIEDLEAMDPTYTQSLLWILNNDESTDFLDLTFSVEHEHFGKNIEHSLIPNGQDVAVTETNKQAYVRMLCEWKLVRGISQQLEAIKTGFEQFVPTVLLRLFSVKELSNLVSGAETLDADDWRQHTEYTNYKGTEDVIGWFWEYVHEASQEKRKMLLQFTTGSSSIPVGGFSKMPARDGIAKFNIVHADGDSLPTASTCFNMLKLPSFSSRDELFAKLDKALLLGSEGFSFA